MSSTAGMRTPDRHAQVAVKSNAASRPGTATWLEVHLAIRTVLHPPLLDPPLQRPKLPRLKVTRMTPAQRLEQRQHLQPAVGVGHQAAAPPPTPTPRRTDPPASATSAGPSPTTATRRSATVAPSARSFPPPPRPPPPTSSPTSASLAIVRTCASVTNLSSARKRAVSHASRPP